MKNKTNQFGRRDFLKKSTLATAGSLMATSVMSKTAFSSPKPMTSFYNNASEDAIKVALVGCGGRGTGAVVNTLLSGQNVQLVAMADAFKDRIDNSYNHILKAEGTDKNKIQVPEENKFVGFNAYKQAIPLADVVILATPPGFRPQHIDEAITQNKHIFSEKPIGVDPAGVKKALDLVPIAKQKKLNIVVGLQRHYQKSYIEIMKRVHKGGIGDILSGQVYWNDGGVWVNPRQYQQTEMEYQMRNWYYFNWLCGDHIAEQHVHNIDVANWALKSYPIKALGTGGRQVRTGKEYGEIFDHHFVEFHYANGAIINSQCRHFKNCINNVSEFLIGTKGTVNTKGGSVMKNNKGKEIYRHNKEGDPSPYQQEIDDLLAAVAGGEYKHADLENGAKSTLCAIMGRMATYSGEEMQWDQVLNSGINIMPQKFDFNSPPPTIPDKNGYYPIAVPGKTKYFKS